MMINLRTHSSAMAIAVALLCTNAHAASPLAEAEPNNSCATAQLLAQLANNSSLNLEGALMTPPNTPDADFYKFSATPGSLLQVSMAGAADGVHTLRDPYVTAFDALCNPIRSVSFGDPVQFNVAVPLDGVVIVGVTSWPDFDYQGTGWSAGSYAVVAAAVEPVKSISGRVVDTATLLPIRAVEVALGFCLDALCDSSNYLGYGYTDDQGQFSFVQSYFGESLAPGRYRLNLTDYSGRYLPTQTAVFAVGAGEQKVVSDVGMDPVPAIGSIRGRIIDVVNRSPLSGVGAPHAYVSLFGCGNFTCASAGGFADSQGRFRFDRDQSGGPLPAGITYSLSVQAEQYQQTYQSVAPIDVGADFDIGDIKIASNPVRFNVVKGCSDVPATGGLCRYEVEITNGVASRVQGAAWGTVSANSLNGFVSNALFQMGPAKEMQLAPGTRLRRSTRKATFEFEIPGTVPMYAMICPAFWFGVDPVNPQLHVQGSLSGYDHCVQRTANGFKAATKAQVKEMRREARQQQARQRSIARPR